MGQASLKISGFLTDNKPQTYDLVRPTVQLGRFKVKVTAVVVPDMESDLTIKGYKETAEHLTAHNIKLANSHITSDTVGPIPLIIGADYYGRFIGKSQVMHGVHLLSTAGGKVMVGPLLNKVGPPSPEIADPVFVTPLQSIMVARIGAQITPHELPDIIKEGNVPIHKLWDLETIGINPEAPNIEDEITQTYYNNTVEYKDGQYWVRLPWRLNTPSLPTNYNNARGQLIHMWTRLRKKENMLQHYDNIIKTQLENKFIEKVEEPVNHESGHYLPHHAVKKDSVTTPIRVVFNCSSKASKEVNSLNDCLYTGPNLTQNLVDTLVRFRTNPYAVVADISKAFLRVGLKEEDRDFTKFLWPKDPHQENSPLEVYRFKSVLFGSCSSPFLLCTTLQHHFDKAGCPELGSAFYMDNLQITTASEEEAIALYNKASKECLAANMPLQSWNTNSPKLQTLLREVRSDTDMVTNQNVLGLVWDVNGDRLGLHQSHYPNQVLTKRTLLSQVSLLFDPLGIINPISIRGRILVQEAWREKLDWDTVLPEYYSLEWEQIKEDCILGANISVPRQIDTKASDSTQLHIFCDASSKAYGVVAYSVTDNHSELIMSKTRVAPIKPRTLPQLELTAIEMGTRLATYLKSVTSIDKGNSLYNPHADHSLRGQQDIPLFSKIVIWTDSEICLHWINKNESKTPYVKNRVEKILSLQRDQSQEFVFNHTSTKENPADFLTRGMTYSKLVKEPMWFEGPHWISKEDYWPIQKCYKEVSMNVADAQVINDHQHANLAIDLTKYSSFKKLVNVTGYVFKFMSSKTNTPITDPTKYWIRHQQKEYYSEIIDLLQKGSTNKNKLIRDLGLYLDKEKIIRCRGRISKAQVSYETKHPILLPKLSHLTKLIIMEAHQVTLHGGLGDTLAQIRMDYWIPKGRQAVKVALKGCTICRRYEAKPFKYPGPPVLPQDRVTLTKPFEVTGVDYTGAITLTGDVSGPRKVYICLFTCASTRAVHLEVAEDLSAETFLRMFRAFAARRSCPRIIISDNATNFVGSAPFITEILNQPKVQQALVNRHCQWKFIPPRAPWQNGFTERMIGITKNCLRKTLHRSKINLSELRAVVTEIETRVNNRPLTYLDDSSVNLEAITPSHLLHGRRLEPFPSISVDDQCTDPTVDDRAQYLRDSYHHRNKLLQSWETHWERDYLVSLRERFYGAQQPDDVFPLRENDIVLLKTDQNRSDLPLARIIKLYPDGNGITRVAEVMVRGQRTLRTVNKLIPLECSPTQEDSDADPSPGESARGRDTAPDPVHRRTTRLAAQRSRDHWLNLIAGDHIT